MKTPKEKAKELVFKFDDTMEFSTPQRFAKKCALMAVDEVLEALEEHQWQNRKVIEYYLEVKQEIEKLCGQFLNESKYSENKVVSFINKKMLEDKKEYRGHIPTKYNKGSEWSDFGWLVDEILNFLNNEWITSYILREFSDKYDFETLKEIIRNNFKQEYEYVLQNFEVGG